MLKATRQQQKMFFALCNEGGWDKDAMENRAKKIYSLNSFADITTVQISPLIEQMKDAIKKQDSTAKKLEAKLKQATTDINRPIHLRLYNRHENQMQFNAYNQVNGGQQQNGLVMYFPFGYALESQTDLEKDIDLMQGTGKLDVNGVELYHYDIFITREKIQYMVEWSDADLMWVAVDMATNEMKALSLFGKIKVVGDIYQGLHSEKTAKTSG